MKRCVAFFLTLVLCLQSLLGTGVPQAVALQAQQDAAWQQMVDKVVSANAAQSTESGSGSAAKPGADGASSDASAPAQNGDAASSGSANQSSDAAPAASTAAARQDPQPRSWDGATDNLVLSDAALTLNGTLAEQAKSLTDEQRASGNLPSQLKAMLDVSAALNPAASTGRDGSHAHDVLVADDSFTVALPSKILADLQAAALRHDGSALKLDAFQLDTQGKPTSVKIAEAVVTPGALNVKVVAPVDTATGKAAAMPGQLHVRFQVPVLVDAALAGEKASQLTWALQVVPNGRPRESKLAIPAKADLLKALDIEAKVPEQANQPANSSDATASGSAGAAQPTSDAGSAGAARPTDDRAASAGVARPTSDASTSAGAAQPTADVPAHSVAAETPATVIRPGNRDGAPGVNGSDPAYATFTTLWADNNDGARPSADQLTKDNEYQLRFSLPGDTKKHRLTDDSGLKVTQDAIEKLGITQAYFDQYIKKDGHGPVTVRQTGTNTYTASVDPVLPSGAWKYTQRRDSDGSLMWEKNKDGSDKLDANGKKIPVYEDTTSMQKQISWFIDHVKKGDSYKSRYETADANTYPNYVSENQKECLQLLKDVTYTVIAKLGNDAGDSLNTDKNGQNAELKWASNQTLTVEKATGGDADKDWGTGKSQDLPTLVKNGKVTITSTNGQTATYTARWPAYHPDGTPFMYSLTQDEEVLKHTEDYSKYLPKDAPIKSMDFFDYKQVWYNNADSPDHGSETGKLYEGGTMTVTNAGTTPFFGMKKWLDDDPSQRPATTYTLWRFVARQGVGPEQASQATDQNGNFIYITRSAEDNAKQRDKEYISAELIAKYIGLGQMDTIQFPKYDQDGYPYVYLLRETVPDGYERSFSLNGKTTTGDDNSSGSGEYADHMPSYYNHDFSGVVTPEGVWPDGKRPAGDVSSYHNNVIINRRVGTTEVTQTKTWKVGSFQDQLNDVTVTFQAERLPQADVTYDKDDVPHAKDGKTWEKVPESDGGVKTVTDWSQEKLTQSVTGTFAKYDENGKPYVYRWVESNVEKPKQTTGFTIVDEATQTSRFTLTLKDENGVDQKLSFTGTYDPKAKMIVNRYEDTTTASIDKYWGDGKGGYTQDAIPYPADSQYKVPKGGIKVQLFQNDTLVAADDKGDTFALDGVADTGDGRVITLKVGEKTYKAHAQETSPWHLEFTGLPKYDAGGSKYNYTVVETGTAGFTVSRTIDADKDVTKIYNTPVGTEGSLTDIRITKDWVDGGNSSARLPIKVDLYAKQDLYASDAAGAQPTIKAGTKINEQPIELNDENNWYYIARLTVYYVKGADGTLKPINGVDMLDYAFRIQEVASDDYEVLTRDQVQQRVNAGTSAYSPVLQNWTDNNPRMFPKDKNKDGKPDDGYVYEVTYGVNREKGSLEVTNRRLGLVNIEIDKTWKDGKFPGNRPASQFTIAAKDKAVTFTEGSDGRIIATIANGGGTYPLSKIGADGNTLEPLTGKDVSISKDDKGDATLTITVDPKLDHSEYEVYGLPKYDGQGFVIEYGTAENITGQAGDYVSSLTDSDEAYSSWWHFSDQLNYSYENKRTGTKNVTFHTIWYDQYVKKVLNQRPDVYLTLYKRVIKYDANGNPILGKDGKPDFTLEKVTGYEDYQWEPENEVKSGKTDGNYYQQATIRNLPKYDDQGREIVYYASAATNASPDAVSNLDYAAPYLSTEQADKDADDNPVSSEVSDAALYAVSPDGKTEGDDPTANARGYAVRESSTFDFKIANKITGEGTKIWSNVPGIVDEADLPDISVYLQRRVADEGYPVNSYLGATDLQQVDWKDPEVTGVNPDTKTYGVKTFAPGASSADKNAIQDGWTVLAWTHRVVRTGQNTYTYTFTNYGDNTGINENVGGKGSDAWGTPAPVDTETLPRYDQYGRRYEYRAVEVIDGLIDWGKVGEAIPGGVSFEDLKKGASESLYDKVYDVTHGETTSFSMTNVYKPHTGKLTVKKVYPSDNREKGDAFPDVTFHLYRYYIKGTGEDAGKKSDPQLVQTKVLAGSDVKSNNGGVTGSGTVTFDDVDIYAPNGQYWVYYVTEDKVNGYDGAAAMGDVDVNNGTFGIDPDKTTGVVTSGDLATVPQANGMFGNPTHTEVGDNESVDVTFKNTYRPDTLTLKSGNKQWGDHGDAFGTRPKIDKFQDLITLTRTYGNRTPERVKFTDYIQQHAADDGKPDSNPLTKPNLFVWRQFGETDDNWFFEILNLERWAPDGTPWKYTITEDGANGLLAGPGYSNNDGNGGYNKGTSGDTTTGSADIAGSWFNDLRGRVSVTKAWKGDNEQLRPASVTMQLQARKKRSNDTWHKAGEYWNSLVTDAEKKGKISETWPIATEMVLTAQNNWTDSREKLPVKIHGTEIEYRVVETKIDGNPVTVNDDGTYANAPGDNKTGKDFVYSYATEGTSTSAEGDGKGDSTQGWDKTDATVTNTLQSTSLKVTKTWDDTNNAWGVRPSVTFKLQRKVGNAAWAWVVPRGQDATEGNALSVTIDPDKGEAEFTALPKYDAYGNEYTYRAVEVVPTGYELVDGQSVDGSTDTKANTDEKDTSFENRPETISLSGEKVWSVNGKTNLIPKSIGLTLQRKVAGGQYEDVKIPAALKDTVTFTWTQPSGSTTWTYSITGLPKYDAKGNKFTYNVRENVPAGFSSSVTGDTTIGADGNQTAPTITNTLKSGSVSLSKVDADNQNKKLDGAEFKLQRQGDLGSWTDVASGLATGRSYGMNDQNNGLMDADGTAGSTGVLSISGLLPGTTYRFVETKAPDGYAFAGVDKVMSKPFTIEQASIDQPITLDSVSNAPIKFTLDKRGTKGEDGADNVTLNGVTIELVGASDGKTYASWTRDVSGAVSATVWADGDSTKVGNTTTDGSIVGLPAGTYSVIEKNVPADYVKTTTVGTLTVGDDGNVTVTPATNLPAGASFKAETQNGSTLISVVLTDPVVKGSLKLDKQVSNGNALPGATFNLYRKGAADSDELIATGLKTDGGGVIDTSTATGVSFVSGSSVAKYGRTKLSEGLLPGTYYFKETSSTPGAATPNEDASKSPDFVIPANGGADGKVDPQVEQTMKNVTFSASAQLTKIDADAGINGVPLNGAVFALSYKAPGASVYKTATSYLYSGRTYLLGWDSSWGVPGVATTQDVTSQGVLLLRNLKKGDYLLTEVPNMNPGYQGFQIQIPGVPANAIPPNTIPFSVNEADNGSTKLLGTNGKLENKRKLGSASLKKTGKDGVALDGVTFKLQVKQGDSWQDTGLDELLTGNAYDAGGNLSKAAAKVADAKVEGGALSVKGLPWGTYRFVETKALPGYSTKDDAGKDIVKEFTINRNSVEATQELGTITNTYTPTPATVALQVTKALFGRDWRDGDSFTFELKAAGTGNPEGAVLPKKTAVNVTAASANHTATFDKITFSKPGTFKFQISEQKGTVGGIGYDGSVKTVTVAVRDDVALGKLVVDSVQYGDDAKATSASFTNTYTPGTASVRLRANKTLNGAAPAEGRFSFELYAAGADGGVAEGAKPLLTAKNAADGSVAFDEISGLAPGAHHYVIREADDHQGGVAYDGRQVKVTVTVTDDGAGRATAAVAYDGAPEAPTFENTYTPGTASVRLRANKTLNGAAPAEGRFSFELYAAGADGGVAEGAKPLLTAKNAADGSVAFDEISGLAPGAHHYVIREADDHQGGVAYDGRQVKVTVTVTDDGAGRATAAVAYDGKPDAPTFENTYDASGSIGVAGTKKVTGSDGSDLTSDFAGRFTFTLTGADGAPVRVAGEGGKLEDKKSLTATNAADGSISLGELQYKYLDVADAKPEKDGSRSKTFTYQVEESGTAAGVTNDATATKSFTVKVTDDGSGKLKVASNQTDPVKLFGFTNTYTPAPATAALRVSKALIGREWRDGDEFTFMLAADKGNRAGAVLPNPATAVVSRESADHAVSFGDITFSKPGTFKFHITEQKGSAGGIDYDGSSKTATITVRDDVQSGTLVVDSVKYGDDANAASASFTNTYKTTATSDSFSFKKILTGRALKAGEFSFELTGLDGAPMPEGAGDGKLTVRNAADGSVSFGGISYDKAGTFNYTVRELPGSSLGVAYDSAVYTVTVTVTDDGQGALHTSHAITRDGKSVADGDAVFANSYKPGSASVALTASKTLTGHDLKAGEFSFQVKEGGKVVAEAKNSADGTVAFPAISYTEAGEHDYAISEVKGDEPGMTYDANVHKVHVSVTDSGQGVLKAEASYEGGEAPTFRNSYVPGSASVRLRAVKTLNGQAPVDGRFSFELYEAGADGGVPEGAKPLQTKANGADGTVAFDEIHGLVPGTYRYVIREVNDGQGGVAYDGHQVKVTVVVADDGAGKATAAVTYDGAADAPTFANTYKPSSATDAFSFKKVLTGRDLKAGEFSFELTGLDGAPMPVGAQDGKATAVNAADGLVSFGSIAYDKAGTYTYSVREVPGSVSGVAYDSAAYTVTVTVTDDGAGALHAGHVITRDGKSVVDGDAVFANSYKPGSASVALTASKTLTGRDLKAGEFSFQVKEDGRVVAEAVNGADGTVAFPAIAYDAPGEHDYEISEVKGDEPGMTYDAIVHKVHVSVTDSGQGVLKAEASYEGGEAPTFRNSYVPGTASVRLRAVKTLNGQAPAEGRFSFELYASDADGRVAEGARPLRTAKNAADGMVSFAKLTGLAPGDHYYVIREVDDHQAGVTYDGRQVRVTVTVVDDGAGKASATVAYDGKPETPTFANTYKPSSATDAFSFRKVLTGRDLGVGEFSFELTGKDGAPMPVGAQDGKATVGNAADGSVAFGDISYDRAGAYTYTVREASGNAPGVSYDSAAYTVTVTVTDDLKGALHASHSITRDGKAVADKDAVFANSYKPGAASVSLAASKTLSGRQLKTGEFTFQVREGGRVVAEAKNSADGTVAFPAISYDAAGEHDYEISEVRGSESGVAYDGSVRKAHVSVTDGGHGALKAAVTYDGGEAPTFVNAYAPGTAEAQLGATKTLNGQAPAEGRFSFELYASDADGRVAEGAKPLQTAKNAADGTVSFAKLTGLAPGDHYYVIREVDDGQGGVAYDHSSKLARVRVADDGKGGATVEVTYGGKSEAPSFANTYRPSAASDSLSFRKVLTGRDLRAGEFSFELTGKDGAPMPEGAKDGKLTVENAADGSVSFGSISYDKAGTYAYGVREVPGAESGVTYDSASYDATVTVTDDGAGALHAGHAITREGKPVADGDAVFVNSYKPGSASVALTASKTLTGRDLKAGEFSFQVREGGRVVAEAVNGADGKISFPAISYTEAGEHDYEISEVKGDEPGVIYEGAYYMVHVSVTDNGDGTLKAVASYPTGGATFTNAYAPSPAHIAIPVQKVISGRDWTNSDSFSFQLSQDPSDPVGAALPAFERVTVDAKAAGHRASFAPISFSKAGTYRFQVRELGASHNGLAYDRSVKTVTVTVADDGSGALHATFAEGSTTPIFTNFYVPESHQIRIHKVDEDGNPLSGAGFTVEGAFADGTSSKTVTTDDSGFASVAMIVAGGEYRIRETTAPAGFEGVDGALAFSVSSDGSIHLRGGAPEGFALDGSDAIRVVNRKTALPPSIPPRIARVLPQTGDPVSTFGLYAITALGMASLAGGLRGLRRRMEER